VTLRAFHSGMVKSKTVKAHQKLIQEKKDNVYVFQSALEHKIENIIDGFRQGFLKLLHDISPENATIIAEYILTIKTEINLSDHYRQDNIITLCKFSKYFDNKPFKSITNRDRIIAFLDRFRKSESLDPLHKWIGTYNTYRIYLLRFFKWLYYPNIESDKRPKPDVVQNIPMLKRKEKSVYKPTDLWTVEDDLLFLKYCPSKRMKCYHAVTRDTACRPHEILKWNQLKSWILILYLQDHSGAFIECTPKHNIQIMKYSEVNIMKINIESVLLDLGINYDFTEILKIR
jgi:hypothetical protein